MQSGQKVRMSTEPQKRPVGRPAPLGRKQSVTVRLSPDAVAWLDTWGPKQRSIAVENLIRATASFKADQSAKAFQQK